MKNLTSGNIRSQLMFLALPLIAGNMLQQFYHTIDALVIGRFAAPAQAYLVIIFCGLMTTFLYNFCSAVLRAAGDTRAALFSWRLRCVPTWRWTLCLWRCFTEALPGQGGPPYSPREFPCCSASYT